MTNPYQIIKTVSLTEKSQAMGEENKYAFIVHPRSNKQDIKEAVQFLFDRKVKSVNVMNRLGKKKRNRQGFGRRANFKKAVVTLADGEQAIDLY
jgi:large subunit ribosomal protein L23